MAGIVFFFSFLFYLNFFLLFVVDRLLAVFFSITSLLSHSCTTVLLHSHPMLVFFIL